MKNLFTNNSVDRLILGINTIVSKSRYSLSIEDEALLRECVESLEAFKTLNENKSKPDIGILVKVVELLTKFLVAGNTLRDLM